MLNLEFAQLSDSGKSRDHNEDFLGYAEPETPEQARSHGWLFALADGVGGHADGEVASHTAVEHLVSGFRAAPASEAPTTLLARLVRSANAHVYETAMKARPGGSSMATTVVACVLRYDRATVGHVGDSRCYLIRDHQATLLTRDHTLANEQAKLGVLSEEEAAGSANRHLLVRSVGHDLFVNVDVAEHQVVPGDVLVLCCDGLYNSLKGSEIAAVAGHGGDLNTAVQRLVALANDRDGSDNISVVLVRIRDVERVGMYRGRPYQLR
jgi:serine/threonine protein phosphatase PrpC